MVMYVFMVDAAAPKQHLPHFWKNCVGSLSWLHGAAGIRQYTGTVEEGEGGAGLSRM